MVINNINHTNNPEIISERMIFQNIDIHIVNIRVYIFVFR